MSATLGPASTTSFQVAGVGGVPASGVSAVSLVVKAVNATANGSYLEMRPDGTSRPAPGSTVHYSSGETTSNAAIVAVAANGKVDVYNNSGTVDLVVNVSGYFTSGDGTTSPGGYVPVSQSRLLDTRNGTGAPKAQIAPGGTLSLQIDGMAPDTYSASTELATYAGQLAADPAATGLTDPQWQSDHSTLAADYDAYVVNGKDVSAESVTPLNSGSCDDVKLKVSSSIKYAVVGESHAGWDATGTFEYDSSMSSSIDIAVKSSGDWTIGGSKELTSSMGQTPSWPNRGPCYAHQYKVPIEYIKYVHHHICSGVTKATWYTVEVGRYRIPAQGAVGLTGKDVSSHDGTANFNHSPKDNRVWLEPHQAFQLANGKSTKFGGSVSVYGLSLGSKTGYDSNHRQKITAGSKPGKHWVWGRDGSFAAARAGVMYSK
ncbi:hypothetical protein [Streptomyces sp. NPDC008092]|uniref:hypothetical protein n=1 Tax=Streptomyces sp. NPDC008092 TaxID=3364808 RepID=UPI0036EB6EEE